MNVGSPILITGGRFQHKMHGKVLEVDRIVPEDGAVVATYTHPSDGEGDKPKKEHFLLSPRNVATVKR